MLSVFILGVTDHPTTMNREWQLKKRFSKRKPEKSNKFRTNSFAQNEDTVRELLEQSVSIFENVLILIIDN